MLLNSLSYSVVALCLYIMASSYCFRKELLKRARLLVVTIISLLAFPLAGYGFMMTINGGLDMSKTETHKSLVISEEGGSGISSIYTINLESWRKPGGQESIKASAALSENITPMSTHLIIRTKRGYLGYEWVRDIQVDGLGS